MEDQPFTNRELKHYFDDFKRSLDEHKELLATIQSQTIDTRSRITRLEDLTRDYNDVKVTLGSLMNYKWWLIGFAFSFTVLGATVIYFFNDRIERKIQDGISNAFDDRFSDIKIINNN